MNLFPFNPPIGNSCALPKTRRECATFLKFFLSDCLSSLLSLEVKSLRHELLKPSSIQGEIHRKFILISQPNNIFLSAVLVIKILFCSIFNSGLYFSIGSKSRQEDYMTKLPYQVTTNLNTRLSAFVTQELFQRIQCLRG